MKTDIYHAHFAFPTLYFYCIFLKFLLTNDVGLGNVVITGLHHVYDVGLGCSVQTRSNNQIVLTIWGKYLQIIYTYLHHLERKKVVHGPSNHRNRPSHFIAVKSCTYLQVMAVEKAHVSTLWKS